MHCYKKKKKRKDKEKKKKKLNLMLMLFIDDERQYISLNQKCTSNSRHISCRMFFKERPVEKVARLFYLG